jgi:deoxyribodipyrimidine photo-lyase
MNRTFPTDYDSIVNRIKQIDPISYGKTRNFVHGAVSYLSPYISRGVISTRQVLLYQLEKGYTLFEIDSLAKELAWRDYFQRLAQVKNVNSPIRQKQELIQHNEIPKALLTCQTGIEALDSSIKTLYDEGYMHNHCRMYVASVACNIGRANWLSPAQWMYYYLIDGDWASNACNWQWVAGSNASKKYYANQENINHYTGSQQKGSYLDYSYEVLPSLPIPEALSSTVPFTLKTKLPENEEVSINSNLPTFIYNYYQMDPLWHKGEPGNRVLLLDPEHFLAYPISQQCLTFLLALGRNIPGLTIYCGSFNNLKQKYNLKTIYFKEHPLNLGYSGIEESRTWISDTLKGYFPSFFNYWKKIKVELQTTFK